MLVAGCAHGEQSAGTISRVIVKFTDASRPPPDALSLKLDDGTLLLRHERALSGESHLYSGRVSQGTFGRAIQALNQRPDVDYAQADRKFSY